MASFTCPVDGTVLVPVERSGIEIDHCPSCRGVWLDRGELDKIIERSAAPAAAPQHRTGRRTGPCRTCAAPAMAMGAATIRRSAANRSSRTCSTDPFPPACRRITRGQTAARPFPLSHLRGSRPVTHFLPAPLRL